MASMADAPQEVAGHGLLTGKVVVVTAAAGTGIGSATARRALAEGADVMISDHHERRLGETRDQLTELGLGRVESVVCDVTSTAQIDALIASTPARLGRVDVLVTEGENEYVLEVNTLPGMTPTSLLPKIAAHRGMDYATLCEQILESAT